jgi:mannosyltransferase OCH1-like enzyme
MPTITTDQQLETEVGTFAGAGLPAAQTTTQQVQQAIEYLIMKDVPQSVWQTWDEGNRPKMVICSKEQLPSTREWRNAWRISDDLTTLDEAA